jgi:hypothetical protein
MYDPSGFSIVLHCIYVMINMVKSVFNKKLTYYAREGLLTKVSVIHIDNHNYKAVLTRITARQEGRCRFCAERIKDNDIIISTARSKRRKYFHKECAERIHLI